MTFGWVYVFSQVLDFQQQDFTMIDLLDVSWALATAAHWTPKLADLAAAVRERGGLKEINKYYQFTGLLWSFAQFDHNPGLFCEVLPPKKGKQRISCTCDILALQSSCSR